MLLKSRLFSTYQLQAERALPTALTTMPMLFCCPPGAISTHSSMTRFMKGSNPRRIPWTCRPPFNFTMRNWEHN